ncbi:MAG: hypothetical protein WD509_02435 [Candidatus Paceibacterota bacterium]
MTRITQTTLKQMLTREIELLNKKIDRKILRGKSYYRDAQRHQALVAQYRRIEQRKNMTVSVGSLLSV